MVVVKLSSSGKQVQVILDDGLIYVTSVSYLKTLLEKFSPGQFVVLTKLPFKAQASKFPKSPIYSPELRRTVPDDGSVELVEGDALSVKARRAGKVKKAFSEDVVL